MIVIWIFNMPNVIKCLNYCFTRSMRVDVDPVVQTVQILISGKEGEIEQ
jgi:hypothetical protein